MKLISIFTIWMFQVQVSLLSLEVPFRQDTRSGILRGKSRLHVLREYLIQGKMQRAAAFLPEAHSLSQIKFARQG